jgi:hypothetical protein
MRGIIFKSDRKEGSEVFSFMFVERMSSLCEVLKTEAVDGTVRAIIRNVYKNSLLNHSAPNYRNLYYVCLNSVIF